MLVYFWVKILSIYWCQLVGVNKPTNFYNQNMKQASIQNIIVPQVGGLNESDLHRLFARGDFPRFQLSDLRGKRELVSRPQFVFFLSILQQWNRSLDDPAKQLNECDFRRNQFIFSWLKWIAVQNVRYIDNSLGRLTKWYNSYLRKEPHIVLKRDNVNKSRLEEWEIRSSYKSNLPLEIDNYNRRGWMEPRRSNVDRVGAKGQGNGTEVETVKKENNYLRGVREEREMGDFLTNYRKNKIFFHNNMAKNYYRPEFSRDKIEASEGSNVRSRVEVSGLSSVKENLHVGDSIKNYRIKTSMGCRSFVRGANASLAQTALSQTTYSNFYQTRGESGFKCAAGERDGALDEMKSLHVSSIDGMGLMANPFELRLKRKKH